MTKSWLPFLVVLACGSSGCGSKKPRSNGEVPATPASASPSLPTAAVTPLAGGEAKPLVDVVSGKVAVIDLWATWCTACRDVSKNVELLAEAHKGKDFVAIGLDVGEERDVVSAFFGTAAPKIPIYLDAGFRVPDAIGARELPTILVVDRDGKIRLVKKKIDTDVLRLVDKLLAEGPAGPAPNAGTTTSASAAPVATTSASATP